MTPRIPLLLLLAVVQAAPLVAQDGRLRARLPPATAARVERIVDSARAAGLPVEPLVQKALEGHTKGAPSDRIVAAVRALHEALGGARRELGPASSVDELQAGVLWLRAGGPGAALGRLRDAAPDRSLAVTLAVAAEFLGRGWPAAEASATVEQLVRARVSDAALLALRRNVDSASRQGGGMIAVLRAESARLVGIPPP